MSGFFNSYRMFAWSVGRRWLSSESFEKSLLETERIRTVSPQSVHWFPGHMHKVHDARIPFSGRPEFFQKFEMTRPTILLLNKADLAEKVTDREAYKARILEASKIVNRSPIEVYYTQLNAPEKQKRTLKRIMSSLPHLAASAGNIVNSTITLMVVGIPNSGKSTLINALRGIGRGGPGGATRVGRNAGQTRSVGQPIILCRGKLNNMLDETDYQMNSSDDYRIQVFDTPGILEPRAQTLAERLSLCVCGAVNLHSVQQEILVDYLLFWWNYRQRTEYITRLDLSGPITDVNELLIHACMKNNFFLITQNPRWQAREIEHIDELSSNNSTSREIKIPDIRRAASYILDLFNKGHFGRTTFLPEDELAASKFFHLARRH
ncbi:unnamed protein product [Trichobilharzia szidati]|nr:unnamed protein product [Trichobilharzia szidati]CAH8829341.1 unnamed protein product [Trichobilharzia szidati]